MLARRRSTAGMTCYCGLVYSPAMRHALWHAYMRARAVAGTRAPQVSPHDIRAFYPHRRIVTGDTLLPVLYTCTRLVYTRTSMRPYLYGLLLRMVTRTRTRTMSARTPPGGTRTGIIFKNTVCKPYNLLRVPVRTTAVARLYVP